MIASMPDWLLWTYATLVGACVGSFLNVCVYRLPEGLSVIRPRSRCPACETPIAWYHNLPVVSYLVLRGRCRACGAPFSPQYAIVEVATALIWLAAVVRFGASWQALAVAIFFTLLLGIALTDARTYIIPDEFTLGGLAIAVVLSLAPGGLTPSRSLAGTIVFIPISLRTKKLVPFGIFLALGAAITEGWGDMILDWYQRRFLPG